MDNARPIITVKEARKILGEEAQKLTDEEIANIISTLDLLAKDALESAQRKVRMKKDAKAMANLIYDIYKDHRASKSAK